MVFSVVVSQLLNTTVAINTATSSSGSKTGFGRRLQINRMFDLLIRKLVICRWRHTVWLGNIKTVTNIPKFQWPNTLHIYFLFTLCSVDWGWELSVLHEVIQMDSFCSWLHRLTLQSLGLCSLPLASRPEKSVWETVWGFYRVGPDGVYITSTHILVTWTNLRANAVNLGNVVQQCAKRRWWPMHIGEYY